MRDKIIKKPERTSCDWESDIGQKPPKNTSRIIRHRDSFGWSSVKTDRYKKDDGDWSSVIRRVLVGNRGESAKFELRYFEISPKGFSSLEKHKHEHVVICIRGKGRVVIGEKSYKIGYLDTVYISPDTVHQLINSYDEPFGFFCIVNSKRDKPKLVKKTASSKNKF